MKLSRNKFKRILKIRNQTKKKFQKKKRKGNKNRKRSFRENKLNLKKKTLRFIKKGGNSALQLKKAKLFQNNPISNIQEILYIQLLILKWRKFYLLGNECYIVPYSTDPNSSYRKLFGDFLNKPGEKNILENFKNKNISASNILTDAFKTSYPDKKITLPPKQVVWSLLHHYACQINGYFVIPTTNFQNTPRASTFKQDLNKEESIINANNEMISPGKSKIEGGNFWKEKYGGGEEGDSFSQLCQFIISPNANTINSVGLWMQNEWGLRYGGNVEILCTSKERTNNTRTCPKPSRLNNNKKDNGSRLTNNMLIQMGDFMAANAASQVACLKTYDLTDVGGQLSQAAKSQAFQLGEKAKQNIKQQSDQKIELISGNSGVNELVKRIKSSEDKEGKSTVIRGLSLAYRISMNSKTLLDTCIFDKDSGVIMSGIYKSIIDRYLKAPTDKMLNYWWQKETLLFLPMLDQLNPSPTRYDINIPITWEDAQNVGLLERIPDIVNQLITRRVNGIIIRKNINDFTSLNKSVLSDMFSIPRTTEKLKQSSQKQINRITFHKIKETMIRECQLNYVRAQIVKKLLIEKMDKCVSVSQDIEKAKLEEKRFMRQTKKELSSQIKNLPKNPSGAQLDDILEWRFQRKLDKQFSDSKLDYRSTMFMIKKRGSGASFRYEYEPIKPKEWLQITILSAHQLMLECWSMSLDSGQDGKNIIVYKVPPNLLTQKKAPNKARTAVAKNYSIGDTVNYINKIRTNKRENIPDIPSQIVNINYLKSGQQTYDIQFKKVAALQSTLNYIPRNSPLWMKFRLLLNYITPLSTILRDEYKPLFEKRGTMGMEKNTTNISRRMKNKNSNQNEGVNLLFMLADFKTLSNGKSGGRIRPLNLGEMRVRLCKLWLLFGAMMGWCNYEDLFKGADGLPQNIDNNRYILARRKTGVRTIEWMKGQPWISCGWARLVFEQDNLKLDWVDKWRKRNNTPQPGDAACRRAPISSGECYKEQPKLARVGYWKNQQVKDLSRDGGPMVKKGGAKCDIREILLRVKIPAGASLKDSLQFSSSPEEQSASNLNIEQMANPFTTQAMNAFAKNFQITKIMATSSSCGGDCKFNKQCKIPSGSVPKFMNCRPIIAPYTNENIITWINTNRSRQNKEECLKRQNLLGPPPDSTSTKIAKGLSSAKNIALSEITNEDSTTRKGLRSMKNTIHGQFQKAQTFLNKMTKQSQDNLQQMYTGIECDDECKKRIADQRFITMPIGKQFIYILIQPMPGIKSQYSVSVMRQPTGPDAVQATAMLSAVASGNSNLIKYQKDKPVVTTAANPVATTAANPVNVPVALEVVEFRK